MEGRTLKVEMAAGAGQGDIRLLGVAHQALPLFGEALVGAVVVHPQALKCREGVNLIADAVPGYRDAVGDLVQIIQGILHKVIGLEGIGLMLVQTLI